LGYGHIRPECGNLRSKGKSFNAIQSDESDKDDPKETFEDGIKYLAFLVSYESSHESGDYKSLDTTESSNDESEREYESYDLQAAYNTLFEEFSKLQNLNKKTLKNWKRLNLRKINWMIHMLCVIL
jgi:hypothetical protein